MAQIPLEFEPLIITCAQKVRCALRTRVKAALAMA
jgi:hypothetical protein